MKISSGWDLLPSVFFGTLHKGWSTPAHTWGSSLKQIHLKMVAKPPSPTENKEQHLTWSLEGLQSSQMPSWQPSGAQKLCDGGRALPWKAAWALPRPPCWRAPQGSCRFPSPGPHGHVMPSAGPAMRWIGGIAPCGATQKLCSPKCWGRPSPSSEHSLQGHCLTHTRPLLALFIPTPWLTGPAQPFSAPQEAFGECLLLRALYRPWVTWEAPEMELSHPSQDLAKDLHSDFSAAGEGRRTSAWRGCQKLIKTTNTNWREDSACDTVHQSGQVGLVGYVKPSSPQRALSTFPPPQG